MKTIISTNLKSESGITNAGKSVRRLEEIRDEMTALIAEADKLVRKAAPGRTYSAAKSYWINNIKSALGDSEFGHTSSTTMQDTVDEIGNL